MFVVVCYDIAEDRRRLKAMKTLKGYGNHVQESVFECDLEARQLQRLLEQLQHRLLKCIKLAEDSLRLYRLREPREQHVPVFGERRELDLREALLV